MKKHYSHSTNQNVARQEPLLKLRRPRSLFARLSYCISYFGLVLMMLCILTCFGSYLHALGVKVLLSSVLCAYEMSVRCIFRTVTKLYPHYWTVPASGKAEPSQPLSKCKNFYSCSLSQTQCSCLSLDPSNILTLFVVS